LKLSLIAFALAAKAIVNAARRRLRIAQNTTRIFVTACTGVS
jgi:hypothetical protein